MRSKKIIIIALVIAMMITMSGCIQMVLELDIKEDMSANFDMKVGILKEYSDMMEDMWKDYEGVEKLGYTVAPYEDDDYTGMEVTGKVKDITKQNDISDNFLSDSQAVFISYKEEGGKKIVTLDLPVNSFYGGSEDMSLEEMNEYAKTDIRLVVTFPYDVVEHNATSASGRTLTWDISKMTDDNMHAVAEGKAASVGSKLIKGLLLGVGALAIAGIVVLVLTKSGKKKQTEAVARATVDTTETASTATASTITSETTGQSIDDYDKVNAETADENPFEQEHK
ncbi:MAG: hypothetical protein J5928_00295 [Firmicutes bacterium]|nr:hypothetical protein [Bacillota bacterium]